MLADRNETQKQNKTKNKKSTFKCVIRWSIGNSFGASTSMSELLIRFSLHLQSVVSTLFSAVVVFQSALPTNLS